MKYELIPNWMKLELKCAHCGTKRSVKYRLVNGNVVCNRCVIEFQKESSTEMKSEKGAK